MGLICQKGTVPGGCHQVDAGQADQGRGTDHEVAEPGPRPLIFITRG